MGAYDYIKQTFQQEYKERSPIYRQRLSAWNKQGVVVKLERPTNIARARELGYKAKQGIIVVRARAKKGRRKRPHPDLGRKPGRMPLFFSPGRSLQAICEQRANARHPNCEVLNSYWVGEDGSNKYFEVILYDRVHPSGSQGMPKQKGRAQRGLTSAGRKNRGLRVAGRRHG